MVGDDCGELAIRCSVKAYLLYLIGCMLFTDKTYTWMPVDYLQCLEDFDRVQTYVWGVVALAFLYPQLGVANKSQAQQIFSYLMLMKGWIYKHFFLIVPHRNIYYQPNQPHIHHYLLHRETSCLMDNKMTLRESLDAWGLIEYCVYFYIV